MTFVKYLPILILSGIITSCGENAPDINIFPVSKDLQLGRQTAAEIRDNPQEFPILPKAENSEIYALVQGMADEIVERGNVPHADVFPYEVTIINRDIKNAFATPGGYIYLYTGLINFLQTEDQLAGVIAHEIAHAAERHSTEQLTSQYGISTVVSLLAGDGAAELVGQIAGSLLNLRFSRGDEAEADALSVHYLCNTDYAANGAAGFFEMTQNQEVNLEFLSTHPSPENRVADINALAEGMKCN